MRIAGLVIAGGAGTRMGGETPKPLIEIGGRSCLDRALGVLGTGCDILLVGASGPAFARPGVTLVPDRRPERLGPLAAIEAAHRHLEGTGATHLVTVPGDTPFLPHALVRRLTEGEPGVARVARFGDRLHPTVALWPLERLSVLESRLDDPASRRSLMALLDQIGFEPVDFPPSPDAPDSDPFFNLNTPEDLAAARGL